VKDKTPSPSIQQRLAEMDALKALAIAAVVLTHCLRPWFDPRVTHLEKWFASLLTFAVPAFLFCSGFLTARSGPGTSIGKRFRRILIPYLFASIIAQLFRRYLIDDPGNPFWDIVVGNSFGFYYYVFVVCSLYICVPMFWRLPSRLMLGLSIVLIGASAYRGYWVEREVLKLDGLVMHLTHYRSPLMWWGYFLAGWHFWYHYPSFASWLKARRNWVGATCLLLLVLAAIGRWFTIGIDGAEWVMICITLFTIIVLSFERTLPKVVLWVSDNTYTIFLYHIFFVILSQRTLPFQFNPFVIMTYWLCGMIGSFLILMVYNQLRRKKT